ncbi:MAG: hypothetical protein AAGA96_13750 [Verrucomicrobiota bacterium]
MRIPALLLIFASQFLGAEETSLPPISADLVSKLNDWEAEKKSDLQRDLSKKRQEVTKLLQKHLEDATRSGRLDEAIAIREVIQNLNTQFQITLSPASPENEKSKSNIKRPKELIGTTWVRDDGRVVVFGDNRVTVPTPEKPDGAALRVTYDDEQVFLTWDNGNNSYFEFEDDWKSFVFSGQKFVPKE